MRVRETLLLATFLTVPVRASAGNDDGLLIGSEAMLTGGAVTATVSDGSSAWYNPAGLAQLRRQSFDINASTYGISRTAAKGFFSLSDGTRSGAAVVNWQLVPSALSYARQLSKRVVGAFGIFVPTTTDVDMRTSVTTPAGTRWTVGVDSRKNEYAYVLSLAMRASDTLRWGVALHGVFISEENMTQIGAGTPGSPDRPFLALSSHRTTDDYGLRIGAGIQWTPLPALSVGVAIQTATLTAFRMVDDDAVGGSVAAAGRDFTTTHQHGKQAVWELSTPLIVRLGVAYALHGVRLMLDGSLSTPLESSERSFERKWSGNARAGALFALSDGLSLGAGVFTDLNGKRDVAPQFLGFAGGVRMSKNLELRSGAPLSFVTTVGVRYARGWGRSQGISLMDLQEEFTVVDNHDSRVRVNEVALSLGGGVTY